MKATLPSALLCLLLACQGRVDAPAGAKAKEGLPPLTEATPSAPAAASAAEGGNPDVGSAHTTVGAAPNVKVEKATGPGAASVAELYAKRAALKDQDVTVRGKVVKYTAGVMGKNWLHIQDGTGSQASGDHDVTVTTTDETSVGAVVTVRGPLHLDRDLGAGYVYAVLVEDAKLAQ
jgi:hypothetical protein